MLAPNLDDDYDHVFASETSEDPKFPKYNLFAHHQPPPNYRQSDDTEFNEINNMIYNDVIKEKQSLFFKSIPNPELTVKSIAPYSSNIVLGDSFDHSKFLDLILNGSELQNPDPPIKDPPLLLTPKLENQERSEIASRSPQQQDEAFASWSMVSESRKEDKEFDSNKISRSDSVKTETKANEMTPRSSVSSTIRLSGEPEPTPPGIDSRNKLDVKEEVVGYTGLKSKKQWQKEKSGKTTTGTASQPKDKINPPLKNVAAEHNFDIKPQGKIEAHHTSNISNNNNPNIVNGNNNNYYYNNNAKNYSDRKKYNAPQQGYYDANLRYHQNRYNDASTYPPKRPDENLHMHNNNNNHNKVFNKGVYNNHHNNYDLHYDNNQKVVNNFKNERPIPQNERPASGYDNFHPAIEKNLVVEDRVFNKSHKFPAAELEIKSPVHKEIAKITEEPKLNQKSQEELEIENRSVQTADTNDKEENKEEDVEDESFTNIGNTKKDKKIKKLKSQQQVQFLAAKKPEVVVKSQNSFLALVGNKNETRDSVDSVEDTDTPQQQNETKTGKKARRKRKKGKQTEDMDVQKTPGKVEAPPVVQEVIKESVKKEVKPTPTPTPTPAIVKPAQMAAPLTGIKDSHDITPKKEDLKIVESSQDKQPQEEEKENEEKKPKKKRNKKKNKKKETQPQQPSAQEEAAAREEAKKAYEFEGFFSSNNNYETVQNCSIGDLYDLSIKDKNVVFLPKKYEITIKSNDYSGDKKIYGKDCDKFADLLNNKREKEHSDITASLEHLTKKMKQLLNEGGRKQNTNKRRKKKRGGYAQEEIFHISIEEGPQVDKIKVGNIAEGKTFDNLIKHPTDIVSQFLQDCIGLHYGQDAKSVEELLNDVSKLEDPTKHMGNHQLLLNIIANSQYIPDADDNDDNDEGED
jgi:hypothetical protein